jgi:pimeloyl-ACP methyl ester carboxylesterase
VASIFLSTSRKYGKPTILLLHGFPSSSHMFRNLIRELADEYNIIAPDYPRLGNSDQPPIDEFECTFDNLANVINNFVEDIKLDKYSIYVHDYGAPVGFRLAVKHPERIQAIITQMVMHMKKDCSLLGIQYVHIGNIPPKKIRKS